MSVHKKLMQARIKLQAIQMKKSGVNKFAGYEYFELADFIPHVQTIFNEIGLCGVVSYEREIAKLTITDTEDNSEIVITSPMAGASLKGCHDIQNLGAVETYQRRYLWVTAMEILEHDALDSSEPKDDAANDKKPNDGLPWLNPEMKDTWDKAKGYYKRDGNFKVIFAHYRLSKDNQQKLINECNIETDKDIQQ